MNNPPRRPEADPRRKIRFRETARDIVAKDRYERRSGLSVDTAGAITRALERAYRQGFADAQSESPRIQYENDDGGAMEWVFIPPRPRNAFWSICLFICGREEPLKNAGCLLPTTTQRGTPGWILSVPSCTSYEKELGDKTINPLVRLGLLEAAKDDSWRLLLTDRGIATWRLFLERGGEFPEDLTNI